MFKKEKCCYCDKNVVYENKEHKRKLKEGTKFFCSSSCAAIYGNKIKHQEKYKLLSVEYQVGVRLNALFRAAKKNSSLRNKVFSICLQDITMLWNESKGLCALTGLKMTLTSSNSSYQVSMDRVDSDKGYEVGNIQLVCLGANRLKHTGTNDEALMFIRDMSRNNFRLDIK